MLIDLKDKVAIVTGAGRGIGNEIAKTLAAEGAIVVVTDIRQDLLDEVAAEWQRQGWRGLQLLCDVRKSEDDRAVVAAVDNAYGRIDILVNNAGVAGGARVEDLSEETWDLNMDINLKGTFLMCQAVIPVMKRQRSGRILNAASFAAIIPGVLVGPCHSRGGDGHHLLRVRRRERQHRRERGDDERTGKGVHRGGRRNHASAFARVRLSNGERAASARR